LQENVPVIIEPSKETIRSWATRPYINAELRERLERSNVLVVPEESYAGKDIVFFPEGTEQLVAFIKGRTPPSLSIEVCIEDSDYKELSRYADLVIIASFVATSLMAPLVVNLVTEYLTRRLGRREKETNVRWSLTVQDEKTGRSIEYKYEGPPGDLRDQMNQALSLGPEARKATKAKELPTVKGDPKSRKRK
jgi:hypothetical protein